MSIELGPKVREGHPLYVVAALLFLHLTLISIQVYDPAGMTLFKKAVLVASTPFVSASSTAVHGVATLWTNYIWLHGARLENTQLREQVRELSLRDSASSELREENERLRRLLNLGEPLTSAGIGARVTGRVPNFLSNVLVIDRGSRAGVALDRPVVAATGILGRTVLVSARHAQVQLITNPDASTGVMLRESRIPAVLKGTGTNRLELDYVNNSETVNPGDVVVTSGLDGIYPRGLPVGKVVESSRGKSVFRSIQVEPFADFIRIEEVLVLLSVPEGVESDRDRTSPDVSVQTVPKSD